MAKGNPPELPTGIKPKMRTRNGKAEPVVTEDGTPVYRVRRHLPPTHPTSQN